MIYYQAIQATIEQKDVMAVPEWVERVLAYHVKSGFAHVNGTSSWRLSRRDRLRSKYEKLLWRIQIFQIKMYDTQRF
jgi:hypothetical protein